MVMMVMRRYSAVVAVVAAVVVAIIVVAIVMTVAVMVAFQGRCDGCGIGMCMCTT